MGDIIIIIIGIRLTFAYSVREFSVSTRPTVCHTLPDVLVSPEGRVTGILAIISGEGRNSLVEEVGQTGGAHLVRCPNAGFAARPTLLAYSSHTLELGNPWAGGHTFPIRVGHQIVTLETPGCSSCVAPVAEGVTPL